MVLGLFFLSRKLALAGKVVKIGLVLGGSVVGARWAIKRGLQRPFVTDEDEVRFSREIRASTSLLASDGPPADFDAAGDVVWTQEMALIDAVQEANDYDQRFSRQHPLGQFRIDTKLVRRAVAYLKSNVGVATDTPANRMVLRRHFQNWARTAGLREHNIQHFQDVVCEAFFLVTPVQRDMARLRASDAYVANQQIGWVPGAGLLLRFFAWLFRVGKGTGGIPGPELI